LTSVVPILVDRHQRSVQTQ